MVTDGREDTQGQVMWSPVIEDRLEVDIKSGLKRSKVWTLRRLAKETARDLQKMVRAEAGAFVGYVRCVINGRMGSAFTSSGECACVTCGKVLSYYARKNLGEEGIDGGHFEQGRRNSVVLEEVGCHCQCVRCNRDRSANRTAYELYMRNVYGQEVIDELHRRTNQVVTRYVESLSGDALDWSNEDGTETKVSRLGLVIKRESFRLRWKVAERKMELA